MIDGEPERDKENRIVVFGRDHDISVKTFAKEIQMWGLQKSDLKAMKVMHKAYIRWKKGKLKVNKPIMLDDLEVEMG